MDSLSKQKKLIPISQAAKVLGVSIDTVRRWDKSGVLHSERPDGKNRYFSLDELKEYKLKVPLSISEVARNLNISSTTLRRLEERGLIKPKRNNAGERIYDEDLLKKFLNSDYFLRKKQIKEKILEPFQEEMPAYTDVKIRSRVPEFLITCTVIFLLLTALGVRNIQVSAVKSYQPLPSPAVLAETQEAIPSAMPLAETATPNATSAATLEATASATLEATASAEMSTSPADAVKPEISLTIKIDDGSYFVDIHQKPTVNSEKIGIASDGDTFEFISEDSGWYEIRLTYGSRGFISKKYIVTNERNN